jgi:bacterial/archaeal transporter family protein
MMPVAHSAWLWFSVLALAAWGILGIFQKLTTNFVSGESALVWSVVGFLLLQPFLYDGASLFRYPPAAVAWAVANGVFNALGAGFLLAAMRAGGKASIVMPLAAMYPLVVVLLAPVVLHESITPLQGLGVACALVSVLLLSTESKAH